MYNNNRQFFWEVKQFLTKPKLNESVNVKQPSLLDAVKNVISSSSNTSVPPISAVDGIVNSGGELKHKTSLLLNSFPNKMEKQNPSSVAYTKNLTSNMFNLNEQMKIKKPNESFEKIIGREAQKQDLNAATNAASATLPGTSKEKLERKARYAIPGAVSASDKKQRIRDIKDIRSSMKELMSKRNLTSSPEASEDSTTPTEQ